MPDDELSDISDIVNDEPIAEPQAAEPEPAPEVEPTPEPVAEPEAEKPVMVPLAAMTEERVKRQMLEQQLAAMQKPAEPAPLPDVLEDQAGFTQTLEQRMQQAVQNVELNVSERLTRQQHGTETVDAALQAARESGAIQQFMGKPDAWGELVRWHQQTVAAQEIGDPTTYKERIKQEVLKEVQAELAAKQISAAPSLAGETNMGGRTPPAAPTLTPISDIIG